MRRNRVTSIDYNIMAAMRDKGPMDKEGMLAFIAVLKTELQTGIRRLEKHGRIERHGAMWRLKVPDPGNDI
jgi:hypothetical protein